MGREDPDNHVDGCPFLLPVTASPILAPLRSFRASRGTILLAWSRSASPTDHSHD